MSERKKKVLVVDDEETNRRILVDLFEDDYDMIQAEDGQECIEVTKRELPDLILLDVGLPDISGVEACRQIKSTEQLKHIPIFLVSGYISNIDIRIGLEAGAERYFTKPFDHDELESVIAETLSKQNS